MSSYYEWLSTLSNWVSVPVMDWSGQVGVPLLTALLLGVIASVAPCQLSTNFAALAYISRRLSDSRLMLGSATAYLVGKMVTYTAIATIVILLGLRLQDIPTSVAEGFRKALGPMLIGLGLLFLGVVKPNLVLGQGAGRWLERHTGRTALVGSTALGMAFALAFCPTMFLLFFGFLVPLSTDNTMGITYPSLFALGTTLPLLFLACIASFSTERARPLAQAMRRLDKYIRWAIGTVFILVGINEVVLYWIVG